MFGRLMKARQGARQRLRPRFHLQNGARLERVNPMADGSPKG